MLKTEKVGHQYSFRLVVLIVAADNHITTLPHSTGRPEEARINEKSVLELVVIKSDSTVMRKDVDAAITRTFVPIWIHNTL